MTDLIQIAETLIISTSRYRRDEERSHGRNLAVEREVAVNLADGSPAYLVVN